MFSSWFLMGWRKVDKSFWVVCVVDDFWEIQLV
jgi:hypothetical protein